ncbi:MAG: penicillin-binding protein 2 [Atribacterota bacterium]|nr:penicillin-binding protein 2 [Atribacterota bacterium]MDD4288145.1 penicillin-binding protein 2 [Atribacterota bacterium]
MFKQENNKVTKDLTVKRLGSLFTFIIFCFSIFFINLWYLQIIKGQEYQQRAMSNCIRSLVEEAPRGEIYDKEGVLLITNRPSVNLSVIPAEVDDYQLLSSEISTIIPVEESLIAEKFQRTKYNPFQSQTIKRDLDKEQIVAIEEQKYKFKGTILTVQPERKYLYDSLASHILGYVNEISVDELKSTGYSHLSGGDIVGKSGIERYYDSYLRGEKGNKEVEIDALGREVLTLEEIEPIAGNDIFLTIDSHLQAFIENMIIGEKSAIIVSEVQTGKILAMVSQPGYNPNIFTQQISVEQWQEISQSTENILCNRNIQSIYPPGSIFKLVTAIAVLEEGLVNLNEKIYCPGYFELGDSRFKCWRETGHGNQTFLEAISNSCNVFFYNMGQRLGIDKLSQYAAMLGLGEKTGIDLPGELEGLLPSQDWKKRTLNQIWFPGDTVNLSIGQGYLVTTPFQIHTMLSIIVNDGIKYRPYHVEKIISQSGELVEQFMPEIMGKTDISAETFQTVKKGMKMVIESGTGKNAQVENMEVAGKTGTAQNSHGENHAWFVGYAPYQDPEICITVFVEHGGDGSQAAAPLAREIIQEYFINKNVKTQDQVN